MHHAGNSKPHSCISWRWPQENRWNEEQWQTGNLRVENAQTATLFDRAAPERMMLGHADTEEDAKCWSNQIMEKQTQGHTPAEHDAT